MLSKAKQASTRICLNLRGRMDDDPTVMPQYLCLLKEGVGKLVCCNLRGAKVPRPEYEVVNTMPVCKQLPNNCDDFGERRFNVAYNVGKALNTSTAFA